MNVTFKARIIQMAPMGSTLARAVVTVHLDDGPAKFTFNCYRVVQGKTGDLLVYGPTRLGPKGEKISTITVEERDDLEKVRAAVKRAYLDAKLTLGNTQPKETQSHA